MGAGADSAPYLSGGWFSRRGSGGNGLQSPGDRSDRDGHPQAEVWRHGQYGRGVGRDQRLGVNPDQEVIFTNIEDYLVEGRMVEPGKQEVVMGSALLAKLDRRVGETVTILMNTTFGSLRGVTFKIVGRLESGLKVLNEHLFYLPLDQAQRILEMEGQATEVLLVTPSGTW